MRLLEEQPLGEIFQHVVFNGDLTVNIRQWFCAIALWIGLAAVGWVQAQSGSVFAPDAQIIVFSDEDADVVPVSLDNLRQTNALLRQSDLALRVYLRASMDAIMQGHQEGFALFENWYRQRNASEREAAASMQTVIDICSAGLSLGLNYAIPGSGLFVTTLRSGLKKAYDATAAQVNSFPSGDPSLFLAAQRQALEHIRSEFLAQADTLPGEQAEGWDILKWEYVFDIEDRPSETSSDLSAFMRQLARQYGIPQPNAATIERTKLIVLEKHIRAVLVHDRSFMQGWVVNGHFPNRSRYIDAAARLKTYRHTFSNQPDRFCPVEIDLYGLGMMGATRVCRTWRDASD